MFVSVERADLAARYVNGDWSEISRVFPLIDRFVRTGGWAASVMDPFLTLCERARDNYPTEVFADQVLAIVGDGPENLKGWHGTFLPARIAELVQHFAHRDAPMMRAERPAGGPPRVVGHVPVRDIHRHAAPLAGPQSVRHHLSWRRPL